MPPSFNVLVFAVLVCFGRAEVELKQGSNQTVAFEGNELIIQVDNPQMQDGALKLCFGSTPDVNFELCPQGYGGIMISRLERTVFNADGTVNLLVAAMPSGASVKLLNAEILVATTTALGPKQKQTNGKAMIKIVGVIVTLILLVVIIGGVLLYFCWYKKRNHRTVIVPTEHERYVDNVNPKESFIAKASVPHPRIRPVSATTTTPKLTSTSTTKVSKEKQQVTVAANPALIAPVASTPSTVMRQKSTKTKASKKSRRHLSTTSKTMQSDKATEPSSLSPGYGDDRSSKRRSNGPFSGSTYSRH
uniref:Uncharacterized protein n=1 Tax=Panagrellus redivivus TaxID=6233 RepID=A0A7E4VM82_PANRE